MTAPTPEELGLAHLLVLTGALEEKLVDLGVPLEERFAVREVVRERVHGMSSHWIRQLAHLVSTEPRNMAEALRRLPAEAP